MRRAAGMAAMILLGAAAPPAERVVSGDGLVAVAVDGRPLRLRVEPDMPGLPLVAPALAPTLGLKGGGLFGFGVAYHVGRETVFGRTQVVRFGWRDERAERRRIGWMSRPYAPPADGTIGPGGLPEPVVRFVLHPAHPGERTVELPMGGGTGLFGSWWVLDAMASIDGRPIRIRFDPRHARSLINATGAVALAATHAGTMTAETGRQEIAFGIERPFRVMKLGRPLVMGGLSLDRVGVRVTDGDIGGRIAEEGAAADRPDPDEVVVTARGKARPGLLILGADALAGCSSLVFDKAARKVRLTCG